MAFADDWGKTWQFSQPMILSELRTIQPALVRQKNGNVVAFMRAPLAVHRAKSNDGGMTWKEDPTTIANPGASVACIALRDGHWLLVCNDTALNRSRLTACLSDDEGRTWKWKRTLEQFFAFIKSGSGSQVQRDPLRASSSSYSVRLKGSKERVNPRPRACAEEWETRTRSGSSRVFRTSGRWFGCRCWGDP
jgi:Neuraminidase (sialidase)